MEVLLGVAARQGRITLMYKSKDKKGSFRDDPRLKNLIDAATEVFRKKGFDKTTMNDIADQMGIQKGSVYHYVNSKTELFFMVCIDPMRELVTEFRELVDQDIGTIRKIEKGLENHIRLSCEEPSLLIMAAERDDNLGSKQALEMLNLKREYQDLWKNVLIEGEEAGILRSDMEWNLMLNGMFGMLQWMFKWYTPKSPYTPDQIYKTFSALTVQSLRKKDDVGCASSSMENKPLKD